MDDLVPAEFYLGQNYPNPFTGKTTIKYCLASACRVRITVYDARGAFVEQLVDKDQQAGTHEVLWTPEHMRAGHYRYELVAGVFKDMKQLLLLEEPS